MIVDPRRTIYKVLLVDQDADVEIIHAVYRKLARRYHPDADPSPEAARRMREINEAYAIARDPVLRAQYNHELSLRRDRRATDKILRRPGDIPLGPAGMPPGPPEGSVLEFGRYAGWTLGQVKRSDPDFLEWLMRVPAGRQYRSEITELLGRRA